MNYDNSLSLNVYHTIRSCLKVASYWYNSWNQTRVSQYRTLLRPVFWLAHVVCCVIYGMIGS